MKFNDENLTVETLYKMKLILFRRIVLFTSILMALKKYKIYLDTFINSVNYLSDQNLQVFLEMKEVWLSDVYED